MTNDGIGLATRGDDSQLRQVLATNAMPGSISLRFEKEPSFFDALRVMGRDHDIVAGKKDTDLVGFGIRSLKPAFVNGRPTGIGYLSSLRLNSSYRGGTFIFRGYQRFRELDADKRAEFYVTTIVDDNHYAKEILTTHRRGMPHYFEYGRFTTFVLPIRRQRVPRDIARFQRHTIEEIVAFLNAEGPKRQFFPLYDATDFTDAGLLRGITSQSIFTLKENGRIRGTLAVWDQHRYKQVLVEQYSPVLRFGRHALNIAAKACGYHKIFPSVGETLRHASAAIAASDNEETFSTLLDAAQEYLGEQKVPLLLVGMHERDPLSKVLQRKRAWRFDTRLYLVTWNDGDPRAFLDERPPYLELGSL